jgi:hypothetical protein
MTDLPHDEVVSAVLDGEATDEEIARVHGDAALSARLAELRAARDAIATSISLPSVAQRDAAVAAAVASSPEKPGEVIALDDRRRRRTRQLASIAAALLLVAGIVGAIAVLSNRGTTKGGSTTAAGLAPSSSSAVTVPGLAGVSTTSAQGDQAAAAAGGPSDLGSFQTAQQLAEAVKAKMLEASPTLGDQSAAHPPAPAASLPGGSCESRPDATLVGFAELAGRPVTVIVRFTNGRQTLEVYNLDCTLLFTQPL